MVAPKSRRMSGRDCALSLSLSLSLSVSNCYKAEQGDSTSDKGCYVIGLYKKRKLVRSSEWRVPLTIARLQYINLSFAIEH
jgi:hypothetical protein